VHERQPLAGHLVELGEGGGPGPRPARVDEDLVRVTEIVLHVGQPVGDLMCGFRSTEEPRLEGAQMHEVVLDGPARDLGWGLPLRLGEFDAQRVNGAPHVFQLLNEFLIGRHVRFLRSGGHRRES
jgi:hypothetical protein